MTILVIAAVALAAIGGLVAIVLKMLADGREQMRLLAPQVRLVAPPKEPAAKDDGAFLAGPPFAGGEEGAS